MHALLLRDGGAVWFPAASASNMVLAIVSGSPHLVVMLNWLTALFASTPRTRGPWTTRSNFLPAHNRNMFDSLFRP